MVKKKTNFSRMIAMMLIVATLMSVMAIGASAAGKTGWTNTSKGWVYYEDGTAVSSGWKKISGTWYYFQGGYAVQNTVKLINGSVYRFDNNCKMVTGWYESSYTSYGGTYPFWEYYTSSGAAVMSGWKTINNKSYYFNAQNSSTPGRMATGMLRVNGKTYYLGYDGAMKTGWQKIYDEVTWYWGYFDKSSGAQYVGRWATIDGKTYYFEPETGYMVTGTRTINGKTYSFDSSGALID